MNPPMTPQDYAAAVRAALADLPGSDRETLLEDLDEHLAEVAAEPGMSLEERLGSPEAYAAELRAAYGGGPRSRGRSLFRERVRERLHGRVTGAARRVHTRLLVLPPYRQAAVFAPELRPAWWVLRGYAIALAVLAPISSPGLVPGDIAAWAFTLVVVWASVWLGRRGLARPSRWGRVLLFCANLVAAALVLGTMADVPSTSSRSVAFDYGPRPDAHAQGMRVEMVSSPNGGVYNIFPYAEDGTPLRNVRLYDQDGNPITMDPEMYGQTAVLSCGSEPPLRNAYPLALRPIEHPGDVAGDGPWATCATVTPTPAPTTTPPSAHPSPSAAPTR